MPYYRAGVHDLETEVAGHYERFGQERREKIEGQAQKKRNERDAPTFVACVSA